MRIIVASGKGGVGKSMLSSSLALLFSEEKKVIACDCDVDAPNLGLWLGINDWDKSERISTSFKATINQNKCTKCGKCRAICRFFAVEKSDIYSINSFLCEGCGACQLICPVDAIKIEPVKNGELREKRTKYGFYLFSAQLYPGESGSGKIVDELKKKAKNSDYEIMILDAPAGIGCPVISSIRGCDYAILITEPTPSGLSDLKRIMEIVNQFNLPYGIVVNKWDINPSLTQKIESLHGENFLGKISYDKKVIDSIVRLKPILKTDSKVIDEIKEIYRKIRKYLKLGKT